MYFDDLKKFEDWDAHVAVLEAKAGPLSGRVRKALEIVERYHDEPRRLTKGNYSRHPLRVARILAEEIGVIDETSILIALCHDLGEWSKYNIENLKREFGPEVYEGVRALTWDQNGPWSGFVERIVSSPIKNLIAIKVADKLDNNRAVALSGGEDEKIKAKNKTREVMIPLVEKHYPAMLEAYNKTLSQF